MSDDAALLKRQRKLSVNVELSCDAAEKIERTIFRSLAAAPETETSK